MEEKKMVLLIGLQSAQIASEMGARGYARFVGNYTPDAVIPRIMEVYESLIRM